MQIIKFSNDNVIKTLNVKFIESVELVRNETESKIIITTSNKDTSILNISKELDKKTYNSIIERLVDGESIYLI